MIKNKKLVLSSIAIVFALVVCSIFVNFTMANSDSTANVADANSGSTKSSLTGYTNIDLAIINSNNKSLKNTGEDKFKIIQIVPNSSDGVRDADTTMTSKVEAAIANNSALDADTIKNDKDYASTSYLWRFVYAGQYFRTAVFDKYRTIEDKMSVDAVSLATYTASDLNSMDDEIKKKLDSADLIYIWTDSASAYASKEGDISSELYSWLDNYSTGNSHPLAICWKALGTDDPSTITGNNDGGSGTGYNMNTLAYKLITKEKTARYDNILVTDDLYFKYLFEQGSGEVTPDVDADKTLYKFISSAERTIDDGGHVGGRGTYFKWYRNTPDANGNSDGLSLDDFLAGKSLDSEKYSAYRPVGQIMEGITYDRTAPEKGWEFDNAKILVITDNYTAGNASDNALVNELKTKGTLNMVDQNSYNYNKSNQTWESVNRAKNSELTSKLYAKSATSLYVPSGVDLYIINSSDLSRALGNKSWNVTDDQGNSVEKFGFNISYSNSYYMDVQTKNVSGTVRLTDTALGKEADEPKNSINKSPVDPEDLYAYLLIDDSTNKEIMNVADKVADKDVIYRTPLIKTAQEKLDSNGNVIYDQNDNPVMETVYTYEFSQLNPEYNYKVVIDGEGLSQNLQGDSERKAYQVGMSTASGNILDGDIPTNKYVYDFDIKFATEKDTDGYVYRESYATENVSTPNVDMSIANTMSELNDVEMNDGYKYTSNPTVSLISIDFSSKSAVINYVNSMHDKYISSQNDLYKDTNNIDLKNFDFIFIDDGNYKDKDSQKNAQISKEMYDQLEDSVTAGVYYIVSDKVGNAPGNSDNDKDDDDDNKVSAKQLADIINSGVYRNGSDNKYKVLEIQPDYPIDNDVAALNGGKNSSYNKHMDGSEIKGDYYTIPSDVNEGKAKEELPSLKSEYYQFDLTKAKISYALKSLGLNYSDIELTQVSSKALIGMKEDISTTYDLVYIGGDISAVDRSVEELYGPNGKKLNDDAVKNAGKGIPTFLMYTHTGILEYMSSSYLPADLTGSDVWIPENGNDLTKTKYDELISYVDAGKPIIFSSELTSVFDKVNNSKLTDKDRMSGYWINSEGKKVKENYYIDPSSRMYELLSYVSNMKNKDTIVWSYDPDDVSKIANEDFKYGQTLYTSYVEKGEEKIALTKDVQSEKWFLNNENDCIKSYAVVPSDIQCKRIFDCVNKSNGRVRVVMLNKPASYVEGNSASYTTTTSVSFEFMVRSKADKEYNYILYIDKDRNSVYDVKNDYYSSGIITNHSVQDGINEYKAAVNIKLDDNFSGSLSWYLEIYQGAELVSTDSGLSKVVNNNVQKAKVSVLQIQTMADGYSTDFHNFSDTLYLDIESQWAHKIMYYNGMATENKSGSELTLQQNALLGRHENRFGIVEYDNKSGDDNWFSNLADACSSDYDISLDMAVAEQDKTYFKTEKGNPTKEGNYQCIAKWVSEAEILKDGTGTVDGKNLSDYQSGLDAKANAYDTACNVTRTKKKDLDDYIDEAIKCLNYQKKYKSYIDGYVPDTSSEEYKTYQEYKSNKAVIDKSVNTYGKFGVGDNQNWYGKFLSVMDRVGKIDEMISLLENCEETGDYYLIFQITRTTKVPNAETDFNTYFGTFGDKFTAYRDAKNAELNAKDEYNTYLRRSYGKDFLKNMYSIIVLGPSTSFENKTDLDSTTCQYLKEYISSGGNLFFFHDTMSPNAKGKGGAYELTTSLLSVVGMNRYHVDLTKQTNSYTRSSTGGLEFMSSDKSRYYLTPYGYGSTNANDINSFNQTTGIYSSIAPAYRNQLPYGDSNWQVSALAMSYIAVARQKDQLSAETKTPYIYAQMDVGGALRSTTNDGNRDESAFAQTAKASRTNKGLVTSYPFNISASMNISGTHQQSYSLDLESDKTTVWYSLAGCNNNGNKKTMSSYFAASPYDAMESYFIYTTAYGKGAVTYCGAGHTSVTGNGTKNNDERKLFINVIINSALAANPSVSMSLYKPDTDFKEQLDLDKQKTTKKGSRVYQKSISSKTEAPNFDVSVDIPESVSVSNIKVYYDLDYNTNFELDPSYDEDKDHLIANYTQIGDVPIVDIASNIKLQIRKGEDVNLAPQESYFAPYGGTYTFIVVEVTTVDGSKTYAMIKIYVGDVLFDLTQNNIDISTYDYVGETKYRFS